MGWSICCRQHIKQVISRGPAEEARHGEPGPPPTAPGWAAAWRIPWRQERGLTAPARPEPAQQRRRTHRLLAGALQPHGGLPRRIPSRSAVGHHGGGNRLSRLRPRLPPLDQHASPWSRPDLDQLQATLGLQPPPSSDDGIRSPSACDECASDGPGQPHSAPRCHRRPRAAATGRNAVACPRGSAQSPDHGRRGLRLPPRDARARVTSQRPRVATPASSWIPSASP
jgi:hypothetical protein